MKNYRVLVWLVVFCLLAFTVSAQHLARPSAGGRGSWKILGTTHANHSADHDAIDVVGPHDYFRKLKFKVTDAPLNIKRMIVRFDDGAPENIELRYEIPKGGESRIIDLRGGKRKLKRIEFWYDTKGFLNGKADVTVFGQK